MQESCSGSFARAHALSNRAAELGLAQSEPAARGFFEVRTLFAVLDEQLDAQQVGGLRVEPPDDLPRAFHDLWLLAKLRTGKRAQVRSALNSAAARGFDSLPLDPLRRPTLAVMAVCASELGEPERASELYTQLVEHEALHIVLQPGVYLGPVSYYLGLLSMTMGQMEVAARHFDSALSACARARARQVLWKVQIAYASLLIAALQHDAPRSPEVAAASHRRAQQLLDDALALSQELACTPWRHKTESLMSALDQAAPRLAQLAN